jgi:hypothetical protein
VIVEPSCRESGYSHETLAEARIWNRCTAEAKPVPTDFAWLAATAAVVVLVLGFSVEPVKRRLIDRTLPH